MISSFTEIGVPAPKDWFTGMVWLNKTVTPNEGYNINMGTVTFEPKARTNWHSHTSGQILLVIEGLGYYQEIGKPIQLIKEGDIVKIPKNVKHWHGASHQSKMRHIVLVTDAVTDKTEWLEPVDDADYNALGNPIGDALNRISTKAVVNHNLLWPNYHSKFIDTDPELIEIFDNFAFDEVINHNEMDVKLRTIFILASTIGSHSLSEYKMYLNAALNTGVSPIEIKEVLYQAVPYVGVSKLIDFVGVTNEVFTERNIKLPLESQSGTTPENRFEKGLAIQKQIFGNIIDDMYNNAPKDLLHFQEFLSANCFGDFITRNGLDLKTREMVTLCFLIALGGTENQIKGHLKGNANVGNSRQDLINLITHLLPYVGYPRTLNAIACLNEILPS